MLLLHYTGMATGDAALSRLCDPTAEVSAHYLVWEDGAIDQLVPEAARAWHAGRASWRGCTDLNSASIGIEIVNAGHDGGCPPYPDAQIAAVIALCRDVCVRHPVPPSRVLAHSDVAPARKQDPGELFPWATLAAAGVGIWPPLPDDLQAMRVDVEDIRAALTAIGYDVREGGKVPDVVLAAFQRHWRPRKVDGLLDSKTAARILQVASAMGGQTRRSM